MNTNRRLNSLTAGVAQFCLAPLGAFALMAGASAAQAQVFPGSYTTGPFSAGSLVVRVVGDGGTTTLSNAATKNFLLEFDLTGTPTNKIAILPSGQASGAPQANLIISGSATSEGAINLSADGNYLVVTGYDAPLGLTSVVSTSSALTTTSTVGPVARVVGRFDWRTGAIDTSTKIYNDFSANNIRSAASVDGSAFYVAGANSGIRYVTFGTTSTASTQINGGTVTNFRYVKILNGQLYAGSASGANIGVNQVGTGLPTTSGQSLTLLTGPSGTSAGSPYDYWFTPDGSTLYVADDRTAAAGGGLQKWTLSGSTYTLTYTLNTGIGTGLTSFAYGGQDSNGKNIFFLVTPAKLLTITDTDASAAATTLYTAPTNSVFRGITRLPAGAATATISGAVTFEGLATTAALQPVTFIFHPSDNSGDITKMANLNAAGAFSFSGLPLKNYTINIKSYKFLGVNVAADASAGSVSGVAATLKGGDANNDNTIDIGDFGILVNVYGSSYDPAALMLPDPNVAADFNGDGIVDIGDFGTLVNNYGTSGQ